MVAGAVVLNSNIAGLTDSKLITKNKRAILSDIIKSESVAYGLGWVTAKEIDKIGLSAANKLAIQRALDEISCDYDEIIIDGNINYLSDDLRAKAVIKADQTVPAVSAASIIAKVARDEYMQQIEQEYPGYSFDKHVGYGTAIHLEALSKLGVTPIHRLTFKPVAKIASNS